ncbi:MAG: leucyl aminopeptidase, partial [Natronosporangium sp.]
MTLPRPTLFDTDPAELAVDAVLIGLHGRNGRTGAGTGRAGDAPAELLVAAGCESIVAAFDGRLTDTLR